MAVKTKRDYERERRQRFLRVAPRRVQQVLNALRLLGACGKHEHYLFSNAEVNKIFTSVDRQLARTKQQFEDRDVEEFKL